MPDRVAPDDDPLARLLTTLTAAAPDWGATELADALWLAARIDGNTREWARPSASDLPEDTSPTQAADAPGTDPQPGDRAEDLHERRTGTDARIPGDAVAVAQAAALPLALETGRAVRPWKRRWPRGRRQALDIDATVAGYARSGELLPVFGPEPERWFDLTVVVDRSPAMRVWQETLTDFAAVLDRLGAFRTLQMCDLLLTDSGPELRDRQAEPMGRGRLRSADGRRLVIVVSDCAAAGWRDGAVWRLLREWATSTPVALLNPLPVKLWRRTGLDLPTVRVFAATPGATNARLTFDRPPLLPDGEAARDDGWQPVPVLSLSPHTLDRWSRTVMRRAPEGCGAVLVPSWGRPASAVRGRPRAVTADDFVRTASAPAVRLAVLCSTFSRLSIRLLHLVRQELVPEASTADVAEVLVSGLFSLGTGQDGTTELSLSEPVRRQLQQDLSEHEIWRITEALNRRVAALEGSSRQIPSLAHDPAAATAVQAEIQAFAQASRHTLEMLGLAAREDTAAPDRTAAEEREERSPSPPAWAAPRLTSSAGSGVDLTWSAGSRVPHERPYFFLSYAHTPQWSLGSGDPDHWVRVLFNDLCSHIMALTDLPAGSPAGFMDREMRSGEGWPEKLSENLAAARVFVPLFSPRYFSSEMCGREWYAFHERMLQARTTGGAPVSAIVPALWTHVDMRDVPDSVRHIHVENMSSGGRYLNNGIYGLIKLSRLRDEYEETVFRLAERIVQAAHESQLPPGRPRDYESTPSAFKPRGTGPRHIRLTVLAPTRDTVPADRDARPYGDDALDWNPYPTESTRALASHAEELIRSLDYRVTVSDFDDENLSVGPDEAPAPTILLVDQWALGDEERRRRLRTFDAYARPWVSPIVPRSRTDLQNHGEQGRRLAEELERVMPTALERARHSDIRIAVNGVPTLMSFTRVLPEVVAHTTQQFLENAEVRLPSAPPVPRPRLADPYPSSGPDTGDDPGGEA
ncbi:TIR-like protein FxsC [Streptomyces sp. NPDC051987]|uniref:TIR-like protein FxsC n=1 Tax=Streptomyces sp. NPDC051987 TaxID=3155808 RepID=UPI003443C576